MRTKIKNAIALIVLPVLVGLFLFVSDLQQALKHNDMLLNALEANNKRDDQKDIKIKSMQEAIDAQRAIKFDAYKQINKLADKIQVMEKGVEVNIPTITPKSLSIIEVIPKIKKGVVHIMCPKWQGSGFVITPNIIMTARHCVENVTDFTITTDDDHKLHATRAISSEKHDIAFICVDNLECVAKDCEKDGVLLGRHNIKLHALKLGSITECQLGEKVVTIGSPYGKVNFNSVTLGIISGLDRDYDPLNDPYNGDYGWSIAFQTDSPGHPGNSGCPIFTTDGVVRGVLVGGFSSSLIIAMPLDIVLEEIELIKQKFIMNKYYEEKVPEDPYYNYREDNEYYE